MMRSVGTQVSAQHVLACLSAERAMTARPSTREKAEVKPLMELSVQPDT